MSIDLEDATEVARTNAQTVAPRATQAGAHGAPTQGAAEEPAAVSSWMLRTTDGLKVHVPNRMASISTYVLLEQERWFETEFGFVERLLEPDAWALDIGANHGIYALALARSLPKGRVIAFEPTHEPRSRLMRSIIDNGLADRIAVAPIGLSDSTREVTFNLSADSELNSMHGTSARVERVQLDRLDAFLSRNAPTQGIDFVKLDAEGEEPAVLRGADHFFRSQSPIVMFELLHGSTINRELPAQFESLGYQIYRHLPGLDVLAPWSFDSAGSEVPLNLFAIKPGRAFVLSARGLLASSAEGPSGAEPAATLSDADQAAGRAWLCSRRCFSNPGASGPGSWPTDPAVSGALDLLVAVHVNTSWTVTARLQAACRAVEMLGAFWPTPTDAADPKLPPLPALALLMHGLRLVGRYNAAFQVAQHALWAWPREAVIDTVFIPPDQADLDRACSTKPAEWLRLVLAEFVERNRAHSSYFSHIDTLSLRRLLRHPDHSAEMERRYALSEFRHNREPDRALLPQLVAGTGSVNPELWDAVLRVET